MPLHIYFFGLVSFIGNDKKTDAVLITYLVIVRNSLHTTTAQPRTTGDTLPS